LQLILIVSIVSISITISRSCPVFEFNCISVSSIVNMNPFYLISAALMSSAVMAAPKIQDGSQGRDYCPTPYFTTSNEVRVQTTTVHITRTITPSW
jgi:hypothetical protein